jgi:hypothetical protein
MAKERLVWAIDCDDVLVPTAEVILEAYNDRYGVSIGPEAFYDSNNDWGAASHEEAVLRVDALLREGIMANTAPNSETIEALARRAESDELHLVTGRQSYLEDTTHDMLDRYFPDFFTTVEHTNYFAPVNGKIRPRSKGEVCKQIGADVLLDDHLVHGQSVLEAGVKEVIVWGNYPWNRTEELSRGMVRCVTWNEVFL